MTLDLLPRPREVTELGGGVAWAETVSVAAPDTTVDLLRRLVGEGAGIAFVPGGADAQLTVVHDDGLAPGAYTLRCSGDVQIAHGDDAGFVHAAQTLRQLLPSATFARGDTRLGELELPGVDIAETFGIFDEVLHLGDETMTMVEGVFTELLDVFDAPWIHVGGDECPRTQWRASAAARELATRRGLPGVDHLQRWFTEHIREWLADRGRTLVGWDEIIDEADVPGAVVMSWRGTEPGLRALAAGNEVVMTPSQPYYLDHYPAAGDDEPHSIGGLNTWEAVAGRDPFAKVPPEQRHLLLGIQAALWSEYLPDPRRVEYAAFPRLCALAETAWTGAAAEPAELEPRLAAHLQRLTARGVDARPLAGPAPWQRGGGRARRAN